MTIQEKYDELKKSAGTHERIFKYVGVKDSQGVWLNPPMNDPDYNYEIPRLCLFYVRPNQARLRIQDIKSNGWEEFTPEPLPAGVAAVRKAPEVKTTVKRTRTRSKRK